MSGPPRRRRGWRTLLLTGLGVLALLPATRRLALGLAVLTGVLWGLRALLRRRGGRIFLGTAVLAGLGAVAGALLAGPDLDLHVLLHPAWLGALHLPGSPPPPAGPGVPAPGAEDLVTAVGVSDPDPTAATWPVVLRDPAGRFSLPLAEGWEGQSTIDGLHLETDGLAVEVAGLPDPDAGTFLRRLRAGVERAGGQVEALERASMEVGGRARPTFHLVGRDPGGARVESYGVLLDLGAGLVLVGTDRRSPIGPSARAAIQALATALRPGVVR